MNAPAGLDSIAITFALALSAAAPRSGRAGEPLVEGLLPGETAVQVEGIFPGAEPLDAEGNEEPAVLAFRIEDRETGEPLPEGRVAVYLEAERTCEPVWPPIASTAADADGWVRVDLERLRAHREKGGYWLAIEAPGYASRFVMNQPEDEVVALGKGLAIPIEVRDESDRPVASCRVGLVLGCGHTPDARSVLTDANGRATLEAVAPDEGDLWPVASGFESQYAFLREVLPGDPAVLVRLRRSEDAKGVVLDDAGAPLENVLVGAPHCHRGPWTRTGPDGRFRLVGAEALGSELSLALPDGREASASRAPGGVDRVIRLPKAAPDESFVDVDDEEAFPVPVDVTVEGGGEADDDGVAVGLVAVRAGDGLTVRETIEDDEPAEIRLPKGKYAVTVEGGDMKAGRRSLDVEVKGAGTPAIAASLPAFQAIPIRAAAPPDDLVLTLVAPGGAELDVTDAVLAGERVAIPAPGPVAIRMEAGDRTLLVPLPEDARRLVDLPAIPSCRVTARLVGPDGKPFRARVGVAREPDPELAASAEETDRADVVTRLVGRAFFVASEDAAASGGAPARVAIPIRVPAEAGATIDLGIVRLGGTAPLLRVLNADGTPAARAEAAIDRPGVSDRATLDARGAWTGSVVPVAGDRVVVTDPAGTRLPIRATLTGAAPYTLAWPDAAIRVDVTDESGKPLDAASVIVRGRPLDAAGGSVRIGGLSPGDRTIIVAARGRKAVRLGLAIEPGARRELVVRLEK